MPETISDAVVNAPIVILAGAGASQHLGYPVGTEFLEHLDARVQDEYCEDPPALIVWDSAKDYRDCEDIDSTAPNFEDIYDRLEAAIESEWLYEDEPLPEGGGAYTPPPREAAKSLRQMILEEIVRTFGRPPTRSEITSLDCWTYLLPAIHPGGGQILPVFTTNYDIAFETVLSHIWENAGYEFRDAFNRRIQGAYPWQAHRYTFPVRLHEDMRYVWLAHLHGCAAWYKAEDLNLNPAEYTAPAYYYTAADGSQLTGAPPAKRALITPTREKRPFDDPYWTEYRYFLRCLDHAETLLIIGHGLEDPHILSACTEALRANARLRIVVLSLDADEEWYRDRLSVGRFDEGRAAFVKLAFERDTMRRLQPTGQIGPQDLEAALRVAAWCADADTADGKLLPVNFRDGWTVDPRGESSRWSHIGSPGNELRYDAPPDGMAPGFIVLEVGPRRALEGEIEIAIHPSRDAWGAVGVWWSEQGQGHPVYLIQNYGGNIRLFQASGRGIEHHKLIADLGMAETHGQDELARRIWFCITHHDVQIGALTPSGGVSSVARHTHNTLGSLTKIALVGTASPPAIVHFRNLKLTAPA